MNVWKKIKKNIVSLLIISCFQQSSLRATHYATHPENGKNNAALEQQVEIKDSFKHFLEFIIKKAISDHNEHSLSDALLQCYTTTLRGKNLLPLKDLLEAFPELVTGLDNILKATIRSPQIETPGSMDGAFVGPLVDYDLSEIIALLTSLKEIIVQSCQTQPNCCALLIEDFNGTFLEHGCAAILLTQTALNIVGTFTLNVPGNYILAGDLTTSSPVALIITASGVNLDLCGRTISGNPDGLLQNGIQIDALSSLQDIVIRNGAIENVTLNGILTTNGNVTALTIEDMIITRAAQSGINLGGDGISFVSNSLIRNVTISESATTTGIIGALALNNCQNITVEGGHYSHNGSASGGIVAGILITGTACHIRNALMNNNTSGSTSAGLLLLGGNDNVIENCMADANNAPHSAYGFISVQLIPTATLNNNIFINCTAKNSTAGDLGVGFALLHGTKNSSIIKCIAANNSSVNFNPPTQLGGGIVIDGSNNVSGSTLKKNTIINNSGVGVFDTAFTRNPSDCTLTSGSSSTLLSQNCAYNNGPATLGGVIAGVSNNYILAYNGTTPQLPITVAIDLNANFPATQTSWLQTSLFANLDVIH